MVLTLYKLDASPPVRSVYMVIEALKIRDVEYVDVNLLEGSHLKEEFLKMNPQHTIPLLKDDDFLIWDSHAISGYLISVYGADDSLYPNEPKKRALIDQRLHFDSGILFPALRGVAVIIFFNLLCLGQDELIIFRGEKEIRPENLAKIKSAYDFTEKILSSDWIAGDEFSLADICCVTSISTLNEMVPIDGSLYPKLASWLDRSSQLPIYKKANEPGLLQFREIFKNKTS
ncbi:glutathione S-transferase epsilon 5 [Bombyx mori]|uniref:Glutathione S-transferase 11 n=1 Tax=Bombyx mori TaxID=7091 RepID=B0LKP4_BOMMO|nr:glutathione S-transferase epsilon 5 [Bombyx mori]ABY66599.1 glutathione S-transferase 11 [Bombyx mori]